MVKVLIPIAEGFEDIETLTVIDVLRRAGIEVETSGVNGNIITSMQGVRIHTDSRLVDVDKITHDGIVLPGGNPGYKNLMNSDRVKKIVDLFARNGKVVAAICAAPLMLAKMGLLKDKRATIYPGMEKELDMPRGEKVVVDGNFITSQGPGTAMEFSLRIVEHFVGKQKADLLRNQLVV